jgi:hypothetical protein
MMTSGDSGCGLKPARWDVHVHKLMHDFIYHAGSGATPSMKCLPVG